MSPYLHRKCWPQLVLCNTVSEILWGSVPYTQEATTCLTIPTKSSSTIVFLTQGVIKEAARAMRLKKIQADATTRSLVQVTFVHGNISLLLARLQSSTVTIGGLANLILQRQDRAQSKGSRLSCAPACVRVCACARAQANMQARPKVTTNARLFGCVCVQCVCVCVQCVCACTNLTTNLRPNLRTNLRTSLRTNFSRLSLRTSVNAFSH